MVPFGVQILHRQVVQEHVALLGLVEVLDELHATGLATPAGPTERHHFAGLDMERQAVEDGLVRPRGVAELQGAQLQVARALLGALGLGRGLDVRDTLDPLGEKERQTRPAPS